MMKLIKPLLFLIPISIIVGCCDTDKQQEAKPNLGDWQLQQKVTKQIKNIEFTFPGEGYAFEKRDSLVAECLKAIDENKAILELEEFTNPYKIKFYPSKAIMKHETGSGFSGYADFWRKTVCLAVTDDKKIMEEENIIAPPIQHELMHMIAMEQWQHPPHNSLWMNEGLATYATKYCNGITADQIYRYLQANEMLAPTDSIVNHFYDTDEMIGYHQAAYMVEFLITNYGLEKFGQLWQQGFENFENIYATPFSEVEAKLNEAIITKYPEVPKIDWESFKKGCK